uniref:Uncharacterized protein n=1 Tax=Meloidogyne incognita TaxID=6306 RepID=A0A914LDL2_MELIC
MGDKHSTKDIPLFEGIAPIIPLQGNPQRLTALMDKQNIYITKTNNHLLKPKNIFPQLISPFTILKPNIKEEKNSIEEPLKNQQMLYGATPIGGIYSEIEHEEEDEDDEREDVEVKEGSLLPFGMKEKMEGNEENKRRKENNQLTLTPNEQKNVIEDLDEDNNSRIPSHHRGWSERLEKSLEKRT